MSEKYKVIFFIPGRIRIKILNLPEKVQHAYEQSGVLEKEVGIYSVQLNLRTKNLLICYDARQIHNSQMVHLIEKIFCDQSPMFQELSRLHTVQTKEHLSSNVVKKNDGIEKRVFQSVLFIGSITFMYIRRFKQLFSILIFSLPFAISLSSILVWRFAMQRAHQKQIYVNNKFVLKNMEQVETVSIDESSLFLQNAGEYQAIDSKMYDFIFALREKGITDIRIVTKKGKWVFSHIARSLGIDNIMHFQNGNLDIALLEDNSLFVFSNKSFYAQGEKFNGISLFVHDKAEDNFFVGDISISLRELYKIPWLIEFSRYCEEIRMRCQNISIAVNYFGVFAASLGYLDPFGAFCLYCMNLLWQPIYLENKVLDYEKGRLCCQITNS